MPPLQLHRLQGEQEQICGEGGMREHVQVNLYCQIEWEFSSGFEHILKSASSIQAQIEACQRQAGLYDAQDGWDMPREDRGLVF